MTAGFGPCKLVHTAQDKQQRGRKPHPVCRQHFRTVSISEHGSVKLDHMNGASKKASFSTYFGLISDGFASFKRWSALTYSQTAQSSSSLEHLSGLDWAKTAWRIPPGAHMLTAIKLVSNDNEESNAGPKGVDGDGYFTEDSCDFPARGSNDLLIGVFIRDLNGADKSSQPFILDPFSFHSSAFHRRCTTKHASLRWGWRTGNHCKIKGSESDRRGTNLRAVTEDHQATDNEDKHELKGRIRKELMLFLIMQQFCVGHTWWRRWHKCLFEGDTWCVLCVVRTLTIWSITPAVIPPAILNAAGKLRRPAPRAAFTTITTAPSDDTPAVLLVSASRCRSVSTLGLCRSHALSPELMLPAPAQSSTSLWIAIETSGEGKAGQKCLGGWTGSDAADVGGISLVPRPAGSSGRLSETPEHWWSLSVTIL